MTENKFKDKGLPKVLKYVTLNEKVKDTNEGRNTSKHMSPRPINMLSNKTYSVLITMIKNTHNAVIQKVTNRLQSISQN